MHLHAHLLSSASTWPHDLGQRWGFTLCAGAILFKASHNVGKSLYSHTSATAMQHQTEDLQSFFLILHNNVYLMYVIVRTCLVGVYRAYIT